MTTPGTIRLLVTCDDQRGIIAAVTTFIGSHGGNVVEADQHTDAVDGRFAMRLEIERDGFELGRDAFAAAFVDLAERFALRWRIRWPQERRRRVVVMASREGHCLRDLIWRIAEGELEADLPLVISNHANLRGSVEGAGLRYEHLPVTPGEKTAQERRVRELLNEVDADLVVLARYMQVLSGDFVAAWRDRIINIHHSFLPAFQGARPYHRAHERGVKIIGATSHYVTEDLDEGPIITQATLPIDHRDDVRDLIRKGRDLERVVLAEAVRLHLEDKVLAIGRRTIVFD